MTFYEVRDVDGTLLEVLDPQHPQHGQCFEEYGASCGGCDTCLLAQTGPPFDVRPVRGGELEYVREELPDYAFDEVG